MLKRKSYKSNIAESLCIKRITFFFHEVLNEKTFFLVV